MPPKKNPASDSDASSTPDPIADATSAIFDESDVEDSGASQNSDRPDSHSPENAKTRNSTISQSRNSADDDAAADASAGKESETARQERIPGPYVPAEVAYALQEAQVQLRRITGEKISQSLIIQCALEICIQDFQDRKGKSGLAKLVAERYREKTK